jgi:hypothetical protein
MLSVFLFSSCATTEFFTVGWGADSKDSSAAGSQHVKIFYVKEVKSITKNDRTDIKIVADGPIKFFAYRLDNPNRLAIEMENMGHKLAQPQVIVNDRLVDKVTVVNFERVKKTRAEIWIKVPFTYNVEKELVNVTVTVREDPTSDAAALSRAKKIIDDLNMEVIRLKEKVETMERSEEERFARQPPMAEFDPVKPEKEGISAPPAALTTHEGKTGSPQEPAVKPDDDIVGVNGMVQGWREAWEAKNFDRYENYYTPTFPGSEQARSAWIADKRKRFDKAGGIKVEIMDMETKIEGGKAKASFTQRYTSGRHSDVGTKTLILVKYGMEWKIESEDWRLGR